jgi:hypothetical protein
MAVAGFLMQSSLPTCNTILAALVNLHRRLQARRISAEAQIAKNVTIQGVDRNRLQLDERALKEVATLAESDLVPGVNR